MQTRQTYGRSSILLVLTVFLMPLFGQNELFNVDLFTPRDGLAQSQVRAIEQDSRGYLWFGTHSGISRFDGLNFRSFKPGGAEGLRGNFVADILEDSQGRIWVATDRGAGYFDGSVFIDAAQSDSLEKVTCMLEDDKGGIWFGTQDRGLSYLSPDNRFDHKPLQWPDLAESKRTVHALIKGDNGVIWIGRGNGLYRWDGNEIVAVPFLQNQGSCSVLDIHQDKDGSLWLGTTCGIMCRKEGVWEQYSVQEGVPHPTVFALTTDKTGRLWAGTGAGIIFFNGERFITPAVSSEREIDFNVHAAFSDNEGNLWFGTEGSGVLRFSKGIFTTYNINQGLVSNLAKTFLEDNDGQIWVGTYDKGISIFDPVSGEFVASLNEESGLPANDLGYAMKDSKGDFWFTSYTKGIFRLRNGRPNLHLNTLNGLPSNEVYVVTEGPKGNIWAGSKSGLFVIEKGKFVKRYDQRNDGLVDNSIYSLWWDSNQHLWIGTAGGLSVWDGKTFTNYKDVGNNIITIHEDRKGNIWLATASGLRIWDGKNFKEIEVDVSSSANNVVSMTQVGEEALWLGTELGVYRMDLDIYYREGRAVFDHFTRADGLPSLETNAHAVFQDSEGWLWFGTTDGAVRCPRDVRQHDPVPPPEVNITEVRSSLPESKEAFERALGTGLPTKLRIPYGNNRVGFSFIGINHTDPYSVRYRYRLTGAKGGDDPWSDVSRTTTAEFSRLPSGNYRFEVQAVNSLAESSDPATYVFTIVPAFWQTAWFWGLIMLAIAIAAWLVVKDLAARARARREEERMKFKAEKLQLEQKALYAMMNPHFTFNALQSIQYFIHKQDKISANKFLSRFAKLIRQNLESTQKDAISLAEEVDRLGLYLSLEQMRFKDRFTYEVKVDPDLEIAQTMIPPMILQPFVENSIKHGISNMNDGEIEVEIEKANEDQIRILIRDNGIGVEASKLRHANRPQEHVSRGMEITRDRIALFGKDAGIKQHLEIKEIRNDDGSVAGTEVELLLPLVF
ncbi:MAG: two-component regulator propeller domain-containing protein [Bacteroidia bacterium]